MPACFLWSDNVGVPLVHCFVGVQSTGIMCHLDFLVKREGSSMFRRSEQSPPFDMRYA